HHKSKGICPVSFGLSWGIVFGLFMVGFAWTAWLWGYGTAVIDQYSTFYRGYEATFLGGVIGGLWGLLEGFLLGFFIALFYDLFTCCCKCRHCKCGETAGTCAASQREPGNEAKS